MFQNRYPHSHEDVPSGSPFGASQDAKFQRAEEDFDLVIFDETWWRAGTKKGISMERVLLIHWEMSLVASFLAFRPSTFTSVANRLLHLRKVSNLGVLLEISSTPSWKHFYFSLVFKSNLFVPPSGRIVVNGCEF
jgi:hypothetical protein